MKKYKTNMCSSCGHRGGRHDETCILQIGKEGFDFVVCRICQHKGKVLGAHIRMIHGMSTKEYRLSYPDAQLVATRSIEKYQEVNMGRDNWVKKLRHDHPEMAELMLKNMGEKVSKSVLADQKERIRRSDTMKTLWKKHEAYFRKVASETATRTSQRQDILDKRTEVLRKWRQENPHIFYERCTAQMIKFRSSKPEKELLAYLQKSYPDFDFKGSQILFRTDFSTKSNRRQIDIFSRNRSIVIEFDGPIHFTNIPTWNQLSEVQARDKEINKVLKRDYTVLRVSHDQWHPRKGFSETCCDTIHQVLVGEPDKYRNKVIQIGWSYQ